ncbi:zf-HC2 domain-containing protein [Streptomyces anulatus]
MTPAGSHRPQPERDSDRHLGNRLAKLVDEELRADSRERVLAHLATCENCKTEVEWQRRVRGLSATWTTEAARISQERFEGDPAPAAFRIHGLHETPVRARPRREPRAERWTSLAARLAGDRRDMRAAWLADLDGRPEDGVSLTTWQQRRYALGFLVAAVRFILRDSLGHLWHPVDWMLATRNRREAFIGVPPALLVLYIAKHDGVHTLLTEGWGWVGGCGVAMFALVCWLQRVRGIEVAEGSPPDAE